MTTKPTNTFLGIETSVAGEVKQFSEGTTIPANWREANRPYYNATDAQAQPSNYIDFEPAKHAGKEIPKNGSLISTKNLNSLSTDWSNKLPVFANGYYFLGVPGGIALSSDMDTWEYINLFEQLPPTRRNTGFSGTGTANMFAYDSVKKLYVCMCENAMFVSVDARNWVVRKQFNNGTIYNYFRLDANTAVITTSGSNGYLYRTADNWGTWSVLTNTPSVSHFNTIQYGSNLVVYGATTQYKSTDGLNWTTFSFPWSTSNINSFQYLVHAGRLYAVVIYNSTNLTSVYSTDDFTNWTTHTTTLSLSINGRRIASYAGKLWALDSSVTPKRLVNSVNGDTWSQVTFESFDDISHNNILSAIGGADSIYNVNDRLMIQGGSSNKLGQKPVSFFYTSLDGKRWRGCTTPSDTYGNNTLIFYSPILGYDTTLSPSGAYIVKEGSTSYAMTNTAFLSSTDNFVSDVTYLGNTTLSPSQPRYLVKRNNTFIGFANSGTISYSLDSGTTWTKVTQTGITSAFPILQKTSFDTYVIVSTSATSRFTVTVSFSGDTPTITKSASQLPAGSDVNFSYTPQFFIEYPVGTYVVVGKKTSTTNSDIFTWFKWTSTDQGANWAIDETSILFDGTAPNVTSVFTYGGKVFAGTSSGLFQSTDLVTWSFVNKVPKIYMSPRPVFLSDRVAFSAGTQSFWTKDGVNWYSFDFSNIAFDPSIPSQIVTPGTLQSTFSDGDYVYYCASGSTVVRYGKNDTSGQSATVLNKVTYQSVGVSANRGVQVGDSFYILSGSTLYSSGDRMRTWKRLATFGSFSYNLFTDDKYLYVIPTSSVNGTVTYLYKVCPSSGAYEAVPISHPYLTNNGTLYGYGKNSNSCATNGSGTLVIGMQSSANYTGRVLTITNYGQNYQVVTLPGSGVNHNAWHVTYFEGYFYSGNVGSLSSTDYWKSADGITWTKETRFDAFYPLYFYRCFSKLFAMCYRDGQYRIYEVPDINDLSTWIYRNSVGVRCYAPYFYGSDTDDTAAVVANQYTVLSIYPLGEFNGEFYAVLGSGLVAKSTNGYNFDLIDQAWGGNQMLFLEDRLVSLGYSSSRTDTIEIPFKKVTTPNQYVVSVAPVNSTTYVYKP